VAAAAMAVPATRDRVVASSPLASETVSGRTLLWQESLKLVAADPVLGVGPSGFLDALPREHDAKWQRQIGPANPPDSPHDWILQAASAGGVPLALLACVLAAEVLRRGRRARSQQPTAGEEAVFTGLLAALAGYGVALLFHLTSPGTTPLAAFMAGTLVAVPAAPRAAGRRLLEGAAAVAAFLLCLLLVLAAVAEIPLRNATEAVAAGNYAGAAHDYSLAQDLRPWDGEIHSAEAFAFATAAEEDASAGLQSVEQAALTYGLGAARSELSDYPHSVEALENLSQLDAFSGRLAAAGRLLARASVLDPGDPQVLLSQGDLALQAGDCGAAVALLRRSASIDVTSPSPWVDLFVCYTKLGDAAGAAQARDKALALGASPSQLSAP
ncbi:MAG TPA: O-antigen ligase family protein, partial [Acidimicrobiales bacterium]|nr:O-antigen ligase family protein [Acidimicrobiales bacterium]